MAEARSHRPGWLSRVAHPAVWPAVLAVTLGSVGAWALTMRFFPGRFAAVLLLSLTIQLVLVARFAAAEGEGCWIHGLLPLYVAGGWAASGAGWHAALPLGVLLFGTALAPRAWLDCGGEVAPETGASQTVAPRTVALLTGAAYLLLVAGVALGGLPVWCLLALLALPLGIRVVRDPVSGPASFPVIFVGQLILGFIIAGFVR